MLLEELMNYFPIWFSPDENGGGGNGEDAETDENDESSSDEEDESFDPFEVDPKDDDFDKDLAIRTIRKQREDWKEARKKNRQLERELANLKKAKEDEEKSEIELAREKAETFTARAEKAERALKDERLRSAIIRASAIEGIRDPEDAYLNLRGSDSIQWDDEENLVIDMDTVKVAVADLKKDKPYLFDIETDEDDDEDDPGGSPLRKRVRSRIEKAKREDAEKRKSRSEEVDIPERIVSSRF